MAAGALVAALVLLGGAPWDAAHAMGHESVATSLTVHVPVPIEATGPTGSGAACTGPALVARDGWLEWTERHGQRDCAESGHRFAWLPGATNVDVSFRYAVDPTWHADACTPGVAPAIRQTVRLYQTDYTPLDAETYAESAAPANGEHTFTSRRINVDVREAVVAWALQDDEAQLTTGAPVPPLSDCSDVTGRIQPHALAFSNVTLDAGTIVSSVHPRSDGRHDIVVDAHIELPPDLQRPGSSFNLSVDIPDSHRLHKVVDRAGQARELDTMTTAQGARTMVSLRGSLDEPLFNGPIRMVFTPASAAANPFVRHADQAALAGWVLVALPMACASVQVTRYGVLIGPAQRAALARLSAAAVTGWLALFVLIAITADQERATAILSGVATGLRPTAFAVAAYALVCGALLWWRTAHLHLPAARQAVAEATQTEAQTRARAEELETFLYGMGHDLKTPMIALDWLTKDIERDIQEADPEAMRRTVERIRANVGGMERLVHELMGISAAAGALPADRKVVDLRAEYEAVLEVLEDQRRQREANIAADVNSLPLIHAEPALMRQVFQNLLGNAIKYGKERDGAIFVRARLVGAPDAPTHLRIEVEDDGRGVPDEERETIFAMFRRGSRAAGVEGTGLGLPLVRKIAQRYGGTCWAEPGPGGKGSRFVFELPASVLVSPDAPAAVPGRQQASPGPGAAA